MSYRAESNIAELATEKVFYGKIVEQYFPSFVNDSILYSPHRVVMSAEYRLRHFFLVWIIRHVLLLWVFVFYGR